MRIFQASLYYILFFLLTSNLQGQTPWKIQLQAGITEHGSDVHSWGRHGQMVTDQAKFGFGGILSYELNNHCEVRLNYWKSKLEGNDINIDNEFALGHDQRSFNFTSPLHDLGGAIEYHFLKDPENRYDSIQNLSIRKWSPYVLAGLSFSYTDPAVNFAGQEKRKRVKTDIEQLKKWHLQIPLGLGIRFELNDVVFVTTEAKGVIPLHDYLDGISESANPDRNDAYQYVAIGLGMNIGAYEDYDDDGVADDHDLCPQIPGLKSLKGCPDTDGDGITDAEDQCPLLAGEISLKGCPDSDGDGLHDGEDLCPKEAGLKTYNGCPIPDTDGDGLTDDIDQCPELVGTLKGCPDSDDDGVGDLNDPCPLIAGLINGCPDSDNDGIADHIDQCPYAAGPAERAGCPELKKSNINITIDPLIINDIYFETNSAKVIAASRSRLSETLSFASKYPKAHFTITGFADNRNGDDYNIRLSFKRAEQVYNELIGMGLDASRLHINALGEQNPKGDNSTEEGRQMNRRVELRSFGQ